MDGRVEAIHVADAAGSPMRSLERASLLAGIGIDGDRYADDSGRWSDHPAGDRQLTLVSGEVLDELNLPPGATRRNVTTSGVDLDALIGREFTIGAVRCRGERTCEPCTYLEGMIGRPILRDLAHRGGLRVSVLDDGEIAIGDRISPG
ncbi:MAG: MOSC domain-containing protein [Chloroflexi bacterium]|nr:MOSC domain-containing protein [Chloroflexota bacterium]